jgi:23S rRNA (cytidine1920-2'-O)/16S rRNA (cytidine1409-2'-O)-methyltransferase
MAKLKLRLDKLLMDLAFFDSRQKAQTCIMMNGVKIDGRVINKAGQQIDQESFYEAYEQNPNYIEVEDKMLPYVSRGAFKMKAAHEAFDLDFTDKVILDIGASTGGFTDYALQNGAKQSIAIDVGKGQLHYKLQNDPRVINLEETNFRDFSSLRALEKGVAIQSIDMVVIDVSFISLVTILQHLTTLLNGLPRSCGARNDELVIIALLKPQFEAGKTIMDKCRGVIRDEKIRQEVFATTIAKIKALGYEIQSEIESPVKGAKGNIEYLLNLI